MAYITQTSTALSWTMPRLISKWIATLWHPSKAKIPHLRSLSSRQLRDIGLTAQDAAQLRHYAGQTNGGMDAAQRIRLQSTNW